MKSYWWKILGVALVMFTIVMGLLGDVPRLPILNETIRNLYFHVTMWFGMMILMTSSVVFSIKHLLGGSAKVDLKASEFAFTGLLFGFIGVTTGSLWSQFTWGTWWVSDPKLNGAAITLLIYSAYYILRNSIEDEQRRGKLAAIYNIFAYIMLVVFLMILPRMTDSLHPGNGGNPGFGNYDLDSMMRMVFYPAIIGWTLIGVWITSMRIRLKEYEYEKLYGEKIS